MEKGKATKDPVYLCASELSRERMVVDAGTKGVKNVLVFLRRPSAVKPEAKQAASTVEVWFDSKTNLRSKLTIPTTNCSEQPAIQRRECGWFEKQMLACLTATFSNYRTLSAKTIPPWKNNRSPEWSCAFILQLLGHNESLDGFVQMKSPSR